jgi:glycosyltransferase involved in cell wall biosynthesis
MKIALCTEIMYPLYGVERRVYEMAKRLPQHGFDVEVYTSTPAHLLTDIKIKQVSHTTITNPPKRNYAFCFDYWFNLFRKLMKAECDLIDANGHLSLLPCSATGILKRKPVVATIHDLYFTEWKSMYKSIISSFGLPFEALSCKMPFAKTLTLNSTLKRKLTDIMDIRNVEVLQSGIDVKYIDSVGHYPRKKNIIYTGRLVPQKNVDMLIRAYSMLPEDMRKEYSLQIVGDGSERANLMKLAADLNVRVSFTGKLERHEDVIEAIKESEIYVLPSRRESFGISVIEAMCCATPVISTATEGPSDYIKNGEAGFLTPVGNVNSMADRLRTLIENRELLRKFSRSGRAVAEQYDWDNIIKRIADVYGSIHN